MYINNVLNYIKSIMSIEKQKLDIENIVKAGKKVYLGYFLLDIINDKKTVILL